MPRFYFDLRNDEELASDVRGVDLPDMQAAQVEAVQRLLKTAQLLFYRPAESLRGSHIVVEVRDGVGPVLQAALTFAGKQTVN